MEIQFYSYGKGTLPVAGILSIPAASNSFANSKIIPSQPLAAITSTLTGSTSSFRVMVEL